MITDRIKKIAGNFHWFDIIETEGVSTPITFKNNRFHSIKERHSRGLGLRLNIDGRTGFSWTNNPENIDSLIERARDLAGLSEKETFLPGSMGHPQIEPYDAEIENCSAEKNIEQAADYIRKIEKAVPGTFTDVSISIAKGSISLKNSEGFDGSYHSSSYTTGINSSYIFDDGTRVDIRDRSSALKQTSKEDPTEAIIKKLELARTTVELTEGRYPVLLSPRAAGHILGILAGGLNAGAIWKGISPFNGKEGEKLFHPAFTLMDDPLMENSPFSFPFDDEAVPARRKKLINKGILRGFISDLKYASLLGIEPSGNGQRGYASLPAPSFSNMVLEQGRESFESIIGSIPKGIYIDGFIGLGQSNTLTGEFSATPDPGFLVKNGEIVGRVKNCMISDNLFSLLREEIVLSSERERRGASLMPYILFPAVNYSA